jgi:hypothetical protein
MRNSVMVQPMSPVTGYIKSQTIIDGEEQQYASSDIFTVHIDRSLSIWHKIYQVMALILLACMHVTLLTLVYSVYLASLLPLPIGLAICWTLWSIAGLLISLILLKFVVGPVVAG